MVSTDTMAGAGVDRRAGGKLALFMFSGTADKFIPMGVIAQAAAAVGMEVHVFVTGFALRCFTTEGHAPPFPAEFADRGPALAQGMAANRVASWETMLRQAKDLGARVHACAMMTAVLGLRRADLSDLVDDVIGAAAFLAMAGGGETFFI